MRTLVVLICSLALVSAFGAQKEEKKQQKKQAQTAQQAAQPTHPAGGGAKRPARATHQRQNAPGPQGSTAASQGQQGKKNQTSTRADDRQKRKENEASAAAYQDRKGKKNQTQVQGQTAGRGGRVNREGKPTDASNVRAGKQTAAAQNVAKTKPLKPQHFNVAKQPNTAKAPPVKFQEGNRIEGSQNWQGRQYTVFRNYKSEWHDQNWWHSHHNRIVFVFGAPYYWSAGYWFPAWGYYPNAYYAWDGPIYAYNNLPPDQVAANVQAALQQQGYYSGEVDGLVGPLTRGAIADYQRDHGLYVTSAIDEPTLQSLGMA